MTRRDFLGRLETAAAAGVLGLTGSAAAQTPGERPIQAADVVVLNPATKVPVSLIIDDSTCLVNLNRFAMPQFDKAFGGKNKAYVRDWRSWPVEIPDSFVRTFGDWCADHGVKGKYRSCRTRPASGDSIASCQDGPSASSRTASSSCGR